MDIILFALSLLTFASLYLGLTVFLLWTFVFTLFIIMAYLSIRWRHVAENYPYGLNDTLTLIILVSVTWVLFIILGPKPVPFVGNGLTYTVPDWSAIIEIVVFFIFAILILFAILIPYLQGRVGMVGGGGGGDDSGKAKVGVGA